MIDVTRPEAPAALTPRPAPRRTIAVLMNHSGRAAGFSRAATDGKTFADEEAGQQCDEIARLSRQTQRPPDAHRRSLVGRLRDVSISARGASSRRSPRRSP